MQFKDLRGHFTDRIRERVGQKLTKTFPDETLDHRKRDLLIGIIILVAEENNVVRAAERVSEIKEVNPEKGYTLEAGVSAIALTYEHFGSEVSIFQDLLRMLNDGTGMMEIIAHMELRLSEPINIDSFEPE